MVRFIEREALYGSGIGYVDAHLLAATRITAATFWTRDRRLHAAAERLLIAARYPARIALRSRSGDATCGSVSRLAPVPTARTVP